MKRIFTYAIAFTLLFSAELVLAQGYTFRVLANKGANKVKKANSGEVANLRTGATLQNGDAIIAGQGAYIGLMHKSGRTVEVRQSGTFTVASLEQKVPSGNSSVASRYASYVSDKMNEDGQGSYKSRMNATGAVSRAVEAGTLNVMVQQGNTVPVIGDKVIVEWETAAEDSTSIFVANVKNLQGEVIYTKDVNSNTLELDLNELNKKSPYDVYILEVFDKMDPSITSGDIGIKRDKQEYREAVAELQELKAQVPEDSPLNKLVYASYFEEKGLLLDAMTKYREAIEMAPEVEDFQEMYKNFLIVNGLTKE
jgi:hypothetical protein